jgi:hypothetical protein
MAVTDKNVFASTVSEFTKGAAALFNGDYGRTRPSVTQSFTSTGGKIDSLTLSITITAATAHWAGPSMKGGKPGPQPDSANRHAIDQIEALNRAHEQKHVDTYQDTFDKKKDDIQKQMIGKLETQADDAVKAMNVELKAACETLHQTEGYIDANLQGDAYVVTVQAAGPGGCG